MSDVAKVQFGPRESQAVFFGLRWGQLALALVVLVAISQLVQTINDGNIFSPGQVGKVVGWGALIAFCAVAGLLPYRGRTLEQFIPVMAHWLLQRVTGHDVFRGGVFRMGRNDKTASMQLPGELSRLTFLALEVPGFGQVGVVKDKQAHTLTGVLACEGTGFMLEASDTQTGRLAAFGGLLGQLCSSSSVLARIQLLERTEPDSGEGLARDYVANGYELEGDAAFANRAYEELQQTVSGVQQHHEAYVAIALDIAKAGPEIRQLRHDGGVDEAAAAVLFQQMALVKDGLTSAGVEVLGHLPPRQLGQVIRTAFDPASRDYVDFRGGATLDERGGDAGLPSGVDEVMAGPMRAENQWSYYRSDSAVHRTWWISEWPRREAPAGFLAPLMLQSTARRTVSIVLEPITPEKANRRIGAKAVDAAAEGHVRNRIGRRTTRKQQIEAGQLERREDELVAGHGMFRMVGFVSTSADDLDQLAVQAREIERLCNVASLEPAVLYGEQDQGFAAAALPLARGLR